MFLGGGPALSCVFRACFAGALLDRGLAPPVFMVAAMLFCMCFASVLRVRVSQSESE